MSCVLEKNPMKKGSRWLPFFSIWVVELLLDDAQHLSGIGDIHLQVIHTCLN